MATASDVSEENDCIETHGTLESSAKRMGVDFDGTMFGLAEELGRIVVTESTAGVSSLPVLAHKSGMTPVVRVGGKPSGEGGMLYYPYGVAVDYLTGNIFVSEIGNKRVQVFDSNGEYLYSFGDKLNIPCCIVISENIVFVCLLYSNYVLVHDLNGTLITQFRAIEGSELNHPYSLAISETNGNIYLCDHVHNRIQVFYKDLPLKSHFGQAILKAPRDIKLTNEFVYVLSSYEPFLYSFNYDFAQTHNTAISSISRHLNEPRAFCIDGSGHFIVSDYPQNSIFIFNQHGELVSTITDSVKEPFGVTLDLNGRIIVVGYNHYLLIF